MTKSDVFAEVGRCLRVSTSAQENLDLAVLTVHGRFSFFSCHMATNRISD